MGAHIHFFNCLKRLVFMMKAFCCIFFLKLFFETLFIRKVPFFFFHLLRMLSVLPERLCSWMCI